MDRLAALVAQTIDALGAWDRDQLERLAMEAEACQKSLTSIAARPLHLSALRDTLEAALASTDGRLRILRGLNSQHMRGAGYEDTPWDR